MANYNDDYQLEEMENSAVDKGMAAKRAAGLAAAVLAGGGAVYGAEQIIDSDSSSEVPELNENDAIGGANAPVIEESQAEEQAEVATKPQQDVHVYHHYVQETPEQEVEVEPEPKYEELTHYYDADGNLIMTSEKGTYEGKEFEILDVDDDGHGDLLAYDANGNHIYESNEIASISDYNYAMGRNGGEHHDVYLGAGTGSDVSHAHSDSSDIEGIHNDFTDEKAGEIYGDDLAGRSSDYNNDGEVGHYTAGMDEPIHNDMDDVAYDDGGSDSYEETGYYDGASDDAYDTAYTEDYGSDSMDDVVADDVYDA